MSKKFYILDQHLSPWNVDEDWWNYQPATDDPLIWESWKWKGQTSPPEHDDHLSKKNDSPRFYIAIFLIVFFFIIVIVAYIKYFYCENVSSRASSVSDLITLCDAQGGCYSLTTPPRTLSYDRPHVIVNCIPYLPIYSICRNNIVDRPPDYDDVVFGDLSGQEVFPKVEHYVPSPMFRVDDAMRY